MPRSFRAPQSEDFEIVEDGEGIVGKLRIKPNGILWKARGRRTWKRVHLDAFAEFAEENGDDVEH